MHGADTVPTASRGYDAGKWINGRKCYLAVDASGLLLALLCDRFAMVTLVWADADYTECLMRWAWSVVERSLAWIVKHRPCVRAYEPCPHTTKPWFAMTMIMSRRLTRT